MSKEEIEKQLLLGNFKKVQDEVGFKATVMDQLAKMEEDIKNLQIVCKSLFDNQGNNGRNLLINAVIYGNIYKKEDGFFIEGTNLDTMSHNLIRFDNYIYARRYEKGFLASENSIFNKPMLPSLTEAHKKLYPGSELIFDEKSIFQVANIVFPNNTMIIVYNMYDFSHEFIG